jgi:putative flippase GtrA
VLRFLLVGGANTLVTAVAFYLLSYVLAARVAFTIVYAAGLAFVVVVTPSFVFGSRASWLRRALLALWYVCTYLVGIGVVSLLTSALSASRIVVVLGTVAVTAPLSFLGARLLVGRRGDSVGVPGARR